MTESSPGPKQPSHPANTDAGPVTTGKREAVRVRMLIRSVAGISAALLVLIGFQTALATNETVSPKGAAVPANAETC